MMIPEATRLGSTASRSWDRVPSFWYWFSWLPRPGIAVDGGSGGAQIGDIDHSARRGAKGDVGHRHALQMSCRPVILRPRQIRGQREMCLFLHVTLASKDSANYLTIPQTLSEASLVTRKP